MNLSFKKKESSSYSICKCWLCSYLKCNENTSLSPGTKSNTGNSPRGFVEAVPQTLNKRGNSLCAYDLRAKMKSVFTETSQNCIINTLGAIVQSDQDIINLDQMDKQSIFYSCQSKFLHSGDKKCTECRRIDLHCFSHVRGLDLGIRRTYEDSVATNHDHLTSFDSKGTEKLVSIFSKDCADYLCHDEQVCKDSCLIHEIQCVRCLGNQGELNHVCREKSPLQNSTAFGETIDQRNIDSHDSLDNPCERSKLVKELEAAEETSVVVVVGVSCSGKRVSLMKHRVMVAKDSGSETSLKDDKKMGKAMVCGEENVWVRMDRKMNHNHECLTPIGKNGKDEKLTITATEEKLTDRKKQMGNGTFKKENFVDITAGRMKDFPFDQRKEIKEIKGNEKVGEIQVTEEKWKTVKMAWKPSGNDLDKDFFTTFPGIAFNIKEIRFKFHEDWRDVVLNNHVLRHSELNSILTAHTFEHFLETLVKKRLMVRSNKGLRTIGSRRKTEKKKIKNGRKYQKLETENDDDLTELLPGKDTFQGKDHRKKNKKRRLRSKNNIFLGYICMRIVRTFSKNVLILL